MAIKLCDLTLTVRSSLIFLHPHLFPEHTRAFVTAQPPDTFPFCSCLPFSIDKLRTVWLFQIFSVSFRITFSDHFQIDITVPQPDHGHHAPIAVNVNDIDADLLPVNFCLQCLHGLFSIRLTGYAGIFGRPIPFLCFRGITAIKTDFKFGSFLGDHLQSITIRNLGNGSFDGSDECMGW